MRIHDISLPIRPGMVHWPGTAEPEVSWEARIAAGDPYDLSRWLLGAHTGTHIDAPAHFISGGSSIEDVMLGALIGRTRVVQIADAVDVITARVIGALDLRGVRRILFRTANGRRLDVDRFAPDYVAIDRSAAEALVAQDVVTVGLDYLSIEPFAAAAPETHRSLLGRGVAVIEGLDLRAVGPGDYFLCCLPLRLEGAEAAPARAVLIEGWS